MPATPLTANGRLVSTAPLVRETAAGRANASREVDHADDPTDAEADRALAARRLDTVDGGDAGPAGADAANASPEESDRVARVKAAYGLETDGEAAVAYGRVAGLGDEAFNAHLAEMARITARRSVAVRPGGDEAARELARTMAAFAPAGVAR